MAIVRDGPWEPMVSDPDDHRPDSMWRLVTDPGDGRARVPMALLFERCAVGDRIPLHRHDLDEVVVIVEGTASYHLDGSDHDVSAGDTVFVLAGTVHGTRNTGNVALVLHAMFPQTRVRMEMLERNPAPGTEDLPAMTTTYDFATGDVVIEGPTA